MPFFDGTDQNDKLTGTVGADEIYGRGGNDTLNGKEGFNTIFGGDGDDTIITGMGRDLVYGEAGDDLIRVVKNWAGTFVVAGYGRDSVSLDRASEGTFLSLDYDLTYDLDGGDPFDFIEVLIRNDSMVIDKTDSASDTFRDSVDGLSNLGVDGMVRLFGTTGDDTVEVTRTSGPAIAYFADGDDSFDGSTETYEEITFGASSFFDASADVSGFNEITITNSSSGQMSGRIKMYEADSASQSTADFTTRFTAVDLIEGSSGDDVVTGSSGEDHFRPGYGNDGFNGAGGKDTVYYDAEGIVKTEVDLLYKYGAALFSNDQFLDDFSGVYGFERYEFGDKLQFDGLRKVENVVGSDHVDDLFRGSNGANVLDGAGGNDTLNGRKGNDTLIGGDGDDILRGFAGKDTFVFDSNDGADRIFKFEDGEDTLVLSDELSFGDVEISDLGRHTLVTFGDTQVTLLGTDASQITQQDFDFI